jgi:hypothetical protein
LGLAGGYFLADDKRLAMSETHAGDCVTVTAQYSGTNTGLVGYNCGYAIRFSKRPAKATIEWDNCVKIYFK